MVGDDEIAWLRVAVRQAQVFTHQQRMHELHRQRTHITGGWASLGIKGTAVHSWHEFRHEGKIILRGQQRDQARDLRMPQLHE